MADSQSKIDAAAEKAFAEAAEKKTTETVTAKTVAEPAKVGTSAPVKAGNTAEAAKKTVADEKPAAPKSASKKTASKKVAAKAPKKNAAKKTASKTKTAASKPAAAATPISKLKDSIMATAKNAKTNDYTAKAKEVAADVQTRAKAAYDKGSELTSEAVEFQKGNFEALVESGKILTSGMQDMGRNYIEDAKSVAETVQGDAKKLASVKSPTELFQLQGEIARRNFDALVSTTSKNTEAMLKLANEAFAPLSGRMSLAAEKVRKAA